MKCQSFEGIISELARDRNADQIEADARERALAHLEECAECELRLQDERALTRRLQEMAREMKSLTAPERVAEQLLKTFRQTRQMSEVRDQRLEVRRRWVVAVAAVLLVTLSVAGLRWYLRHSQPGSLPTQDAVAESSPKRSLSNVQRSSINAPAQPEKQSPVHIVRRTKPSRPARSLRAMTVLPRWRRQMETPTTRIAKSPPVLCRLAMPARSIFRTAGNS